MTGDRARHSQWQRLLAIAPLVLVAYDGDKAGEDASAVCQRILTSIKWSRRGMIYLI